MKSGQFLFKKSIWLLLPLAVAVLSLLTISSCNGKKDGEKDLGPSCMTLTKAQITSNWVPKYTDPNKPEKDKIFVIKFYTTYEPVTKTFQVKVLAFNKADVPLGSLISLSAGVACGVNLGQVLMGMSNDMYMSELNILKADGTLIDNFVKIILTPKAYSTGGADLLAYDVTVVTGDVMAERPVSLPCPPCPNCKPPCEDSTVDNDTLKIPLPKDTVQ